MKNIFKKLKGTGLNVAVLVIAIAVFAVAFMALNGLAAAQKPPTIRVLAPSRNIAIGETITAADLVEKTVYEDENAQLYIPAEAAGELIGGTAALPLRKGHPILRDQVMARAAGALRLSAILSEYPDHSLFPVRIDASNVSAPDIDAFLPGDLVGLTVVIDRRPQEPVTATPDPFDPFGLSVPTIISSTTPLGGEDEEGLEADTAEALDRTGPPLAKDLFPQGIRVVMVEGQTERVEADPDNPGAAPSYARPAGAETLILLVPNDAREALALALQQGAQLFVSLLAHADGADLTPGFTYWDFEDQFRADRVESLDSAEPQTVSDTTSGNN